MSYTPQIDDTITVNLPDEMTRARIVKLVSKTLGIAELLSFTTSKSHSYRKGSMIPVRFGRGPMGLMGWTAVNEAELEAGAKPEEVPPEVNEVRAMTHADIFGPAERTGGKKGKSHAAEAR